MSEGTGSSTHQEDEDNMKIPKLVTAGAILHKEKPFVYVLSSKLRTEYCDFCLKKTSFSPRESILLFTGKLMKCSVCRYVYYCGKNCQREAWSIHKQECQNLKRIAPKYLPDAARMMARLIRRLQKGGSEVKSYYLGNAFRMYKDLMSHYPNIKSDKRRMEHFASLYGVLVDYFGDEPLPNSAELMGMYGRICINTFNIMSPDLQCLGTGMYLGASVIDHSCKPNAVATFEGTTLYIRALEKMLYLDWSQIFISYIETLNTTKDRQEELQTSYYFLCQCPMCKVPDPPEMHAAICPNNNISKCENFIEITEEDSPAQCSRCKAVITEEFVKLYRDIMEFSDMHLKNMKQLAYVDVCSVCLQKQAGVLHKFNVKHVKILDLAFQASIDFQKWDAAKEFGLELVDAFNKYYGKIHPLTGLLHLKLGKIMLFEENIKQALDHLKTSYEILKITHGTTSPLLREELLPLLQQATVEDSYS